MASTSSPGARNERLEGALQCTCLTSQCKHLEFVSPAVGTATFTTKFNPQSIVQVQKKKKKRSRVLHRRISRSTIKLSTGNWIKCKKNKKETKKRKGSFGFKIFFTVMTSWSTPKFLDHVKWNKINVKKNYIRISSQKVQQKRKKSKKCIYMFNDSNVN